MNGRALVFLVPLLVAGPSDAQSIVIRNNSDPAVFRTTDMPTGSVTFQQKVTPRIDPANLNKGLQLLGGGDRLLGADLIADNFNDSIVWGSRDQTSVTFTGAMSADKSNDVLMTLVTGGRIVIDESAELDLINNAYFTRQFWVYGDGTGVLELDEDFVADATQGGTVEEGIGAIRLGRATLLTHHTQSLSEHVRPNPIEGPGINGHMVFTEQAGGVWHAATNAQTYRGGVWIEQDMTIRTDSDLTHVGVLNRWNDFTMHGAWQTLNPNVTVTKTGPASLLLAGEQAYQSGATLDVQQGTVDFQTDAVGGTIKTGTAGRFLTVNVADEAAVNFGAPLVRLREMAIADGATVAFGDGARIELTGNATIGASTLDLAALAGGSTRVYGTNIDLITAAAVNGMFASIDGVGLGNGRAWAITYADDRVTATIALPGDANLDGVVDATDLDGLVAGWQSAGGWATGDFDGSGFVDGVDLGLLASFWQRSTVTPGQVNHVPEPAAGLPLALIASRLLLRREAR